MMKKIIWNYDDVHSNLLAVDYDKKTIGYFRMDTDEFVILTDQIDGSRIPINVLKQIVDEYPDALNEAKKIAQKE